MNWIRSWWFAIRMAVWCRLGCSLGYHAHTPDLWDDQCWCTIPRPFSRFDFEDVT